MFKHTPKLYSAKSCISVIDDSTVPKFIITLTVLGENQLANVQIYNKNVKCIK
jgi:hypothetical protein